MKTLFSISVLTLLLCAVPSQSFALIGIGYVSKERAKELGVTFRTHTNGAAGIQVWLEFKTEGELKKITYIELQIGEAERPDLSVSLPVSYSTPGKGVVSFSAYPAYLSKSTLRIVVYGGPKGDVGYLFKVKDFIDLEKPG